MFRQEFLSGYSLIKTCRLGIKKARDVSRAPNFFNSKQYLHTY